jgi:hypothetical protein
MVQRILANDLNCSHRHDLDGFDERLLRDVALLRTSRPMNKTSKKVARRRNSKRPISSYRVDWTLQTDRCQKRGGRFCSRSPTSNERI